MNKKLTVAHVAASSKFKHYDLLSSNGPKTLFNKVACLAFLKNRGFYLYRTTHDKYMFVRVINNIVKIVGKKDVLDEITKFCEQNYDWFTYNAYLENIGKWFPENFFLSLDAAEVDIKRDTKTTMQVYFTNCIVKITKDEITTFPYTKLDSFIWESQIIQREYHTIHPDKIDTNFDFSRFMWNICAKDTNRLRTLASAIGYLVHNYKNPAVIPAVILNDEVISDNPEGGTGKGLIGKALKHFISVVRIDGKKFDFTKSFGYSRINADTKLMFFDDVNRKFPFDKLFSDLSEGIMTEKKGVDEVDLGFEDSPKTLITSNYVMGGAGNSNDRRRFEIEIAQYYSEKLKPDQEFGRLMFSEWDQDDWVKFDNYIIDCAQIYLKNGLVKHKGINLDEKRIELDTSLQFVEFMDDYKLEGRIPKQQLFDDFIAKNPTYAKFTWFDRTKLQTWVKQYCDYKGISVLLKGFNEKKTVRCFRFDVNEDLLKTQEFLQEQNNKQSDDDLPF